MFNSTWIQVKLMLVLVLISYTAQSQKEYAFDHLVNYEIVYPGRSKKHTYFSYLTNSNDNSYLAYINDLDSAKLDLEFVDQNGVYFKSNITTDSFFSAEYLAVKNADTRRYRNPYKNQKKNYAFSSVTDTIINGRHYRQYSLFSTNPKIAARENIGHYLYIVDTAHYHLPLLSFETSYERWKEFGNLPAGILTEVHYYNYDGELLWSQKMVDFKNFKTRLVISD